jgi:Restriction endonuclease/RNA recognition motif. (a.k.a. RRM, RBD, or RNP domain)
MSPASVDTPIFEPRNVYLGNLSYSTREETLVALGAAFDPTVVATIIKDKMTGRSKGFGFLMFSSHRAAAEFVAAYEELASDGEPASHVDFSDFFELTPSILAAGRQAESSLVDYFARHPEEMRTLDTRLFEELVAEIWKRLGYEVELTAKPGDGGVDVVALRRAEVDVRYLIQCKRPRIGKAVRVQPVRELLGVVTDSGATKGIIATTVYFTSPARKFLDRHHWRLEGRDYDGLVDWLRRASDSASSVGGFRQATLLPAVRYRVRAPRPPFELDGQPITVNLARPMAERPPRRPGGG